jgi:hypothetical protein
MVCLVIDLVVCPIASVSQPILAALPVRARRVMLSKPFCWTARPMPARCPCC